MKPSRCYDPFEMKAKFNGTCSICGKETPKGTNIIYWPSERRATHLSCGDKDYRFFLSSVADEAAYHRVGNPL